MIAISLDPNALPYTPAGMRELGISPAPSPASLHRWRLKGRFGIRLKTFLRGGRRYTTAESVAEFFDRVTAAADGALLPERTVDQRRRNVERAEAELDRAGIK